MTSKIRWRTLSKQFLKEHEQNVDSVDFELNNMNFVAFPGVFSPSISSDTKWFATELLPLVKGKNFLEIGSGTGAIACLAMLEGAKNVTATDINPTAVENIKKNIENHSLSINVYEGSIFDPLPKEDKFDVIFWNHPFNYTDDINDVIDPLSLSVFDLRYIALKKYIAEAKDWLTADGLVLLGTGNIARILKVRDIASASGYKMSLLNKIAVDLSSNSKTEMDLRIYSFIKT